MNTPDWSGSSGDIWARRWRDTDRALADIGAALDAAILAAAPAWPFRVLDVGCGPGTTALALAAKRADAEVIGADLSESLVAIASERARGSPSLRFLAQDAEQVAREHGPFELVVSRHGVMFFDDPYRAFGTFRSAASEGARLIFSCFQAWQANPWAAELASAAAGKPVPAPGREPSGFAFADPGYVRDILTKGGWTADEPQSAAFQYVAGEGPDAVEQALSFLAELGPAARVLEQLAIHQRTAALDRMREVIRKHAGSGQVTFTGSAWIWTAAAAAKLVKELAAIAGRNER
jgi:SAM-dependent methyltransferase